MAKAPMRLSPLSIEYSGVQLALRREFHSADDKRIARQIAGILAEMR